MAAIRTSDHESIEGFDSVVGMDNNARFTGFRAAETQTECNCPEPCDCDHDND
jgi:hypothetical protein